MKFENTQVMNFGNALRGMRNPKESWHLSDSFFGLVNYEYEDTNLEEVSYNWMKKYYPNMDDSSEEWEDKEYEYENWLINNGTLQKNPDQYLAEVAYIGPNDMDLAQRLIKAGNEHRKFMRQIFVSVNITAPLYWWKEFDTYKVGTVANSTSTMHKLASKPITLDCFEIDDYDKEAACLPGYTFNFTETLINYCETLRVKYLETKDVRYWKELVRWLPEGWLQTRTVTLNYENLLAICSKSQRRDHKLNEWSGKHTPVDESFIQWARTLPYAQELIFIDEQDKQEL